MLELSKQLANIVKLVVHNEIQVAQQQANTNDNSTLASQLGSNLFGHLISNTDR